MDNFTFYSPTEFIFGKNTEEQAGAYVKKYGGTKVLIHYGGGSAQRSGCLDRVRASLERENIPYMELGGVKPNPRSGLVYEGIDLCRREKIDFILAVGGGSVIDSAKAIGVGTLYDGDFWDHFCGKATVKRTIPVGTILTIAAAGSEGSRSCVITKEEGMKKRSFGSEVVRPKFSIMDPTLTESLPPYQTASGAVDIMAHVLERYFTNSEEVQVTDRLCEALLLTMIECLPKVMKDPHDYHARANIMWTGMLAHNNSVGVGRSQDWASHKLEHELSALYDCAHGAGLAVIFPAWMEYVLDHDVERFARLARVLWGIEPKDGDLKGAALEGIRRLKEFWSSVGMPVSFEQLGAREEDIPTLVTMLDIAGKTVGGFVPLTAEDCEKIYKMACRKD